MKYEEGKLYYIFLPELIGSQPQPTRRRNLLNNRRHEFYIKVSRCGTNVTGLLECDGHRILLIAVCIRNAIQGRNWEDFGFVPPILVPSC
jgi:hypothetical protein